jgi:hypothetical protein
MKIDLLWGVKQHYKSLTIKSLIFSQVFNFVAIIGTLAFTGDTVMWDGETMRVVEDNPITAILIQKYGILIIPIHVVYIILIYLFFIGHYFIWKEIGYKYVEYFRNIMTNLFLIGTPIVLVSDAINDLIIWHQAGLIH